MSEAVECVTYLGSVNSQVWTDGEEWWIATSRNHLRASMRAFYGEDDVADYMEHMDPIDADRLLRVGWRKDDLPDWHTASGLTVEDVDEPWGDGWDCRLVGTAAAFAAAAPPGMLASANW